MKNLIRRILVSIFNAPRDNSAYTVWRISNSILLAGVALICAIVFHFCHAIICYDDWVISHKAINYCLNCLGACAFGALGATLACTDDE